MPLLSQLVGDFRVADGTVLLATSATPILLQSPNRWAVLFGSPGGSSVFVGISQLVATGVGLQLGGGANNNTFTFRDYGGLVSQPWFAAASGAGVSIYWSTVEYWPYGKEATAEDMVRLTSRMTEGDKWQEVSLTLRRLQQLLQYSLGPVRPGEP